MRPIITLVSLLFSLAAAPVQHATSPAGGSAMAFTVTSPAFPQGGMIPAQYTCTGADTSPALQWSGTPANTVSFALIVDDPDAPAGTWVHWLLWNVPPSLHSLPEDVPKRDQLDDGSRQGRTDFRKVGYYGPCPPGGATHRYFFRLFALDSKLDLAAGAGRSNLDDAMKGHILAQAEYMGTFHR